jgi:hypothetical protein
VAVQYLDRAIRIGCGNYLVASLLELEFDIHKNERLVFHEKYFQTRSPTWPNALECSKRQQRHRFQSRHKMLPRQVSDIIITDELAERRAAMPDYLREKLAFRDLAHDMSNNPNEALPRLVQLAMAATGRLTNSTGFRGICTCKVICAAVAAMNPRRSTAHSLR